MKDHRLAKSFANASWNRFITVLEYKCRRYGKELIKVDPSYTSQRCSVCGTKNDRMGVEGYEWLRIREWECPVCGTKHDRDINAAKNIKKAAIAR